MSIQLDDLVARLRLDSSGVGSGLSSLNNSLSSVGSKATAAGKRMTLGMTTPIVGLGIASTNLAANFDKTMRLVAVATDGPSKALSDLAKKMGAETAFSAGEAADAMLELAKGGMTAAQIEGGALAATMKLATAGGVGLADASTYVANQLQTFGLAAKDADKVTVALAGAANASSASVESLGQGLAQGALAARNAGLSLQETTGVLSLFDAQGLKGSDAGTSLKTMLNALTPATKKSADAMKSLGLEFTNSDGTFKSIGEVADVLKKRLGKLTEVQRAQALETIFGSDGVRAATLLMNGGSAAVEKYTKASRDQTTTTKLANAAMEGTAGAMERASGSIETAGLAIGQVLAPYVERAAAKVEELANRFSEASPQTQALIVKGIALAGVLGPLTIGLGVTATALGKIVSVGSTTVRALGLIAPAAELGTTRLGALAATSKKVAGVGGMLALANGLKTAADEGATMGGVMQGVAGGAGIGAMFGPMGALIGAGVGGGLTLLASSFHKTAEEAEAARIQLQQSKGFEAAKADAESLSEALLGVVSAYGRIPREAVKASFTGEDGKLDADVQRLRDLGVSMDTIVSATLGQASAQKIVNDALEGSIKPYRDKEAAAERALAAAQEAIAGGGASAGRSSVAIKDYETALERARNKLHDAETAANVFRRRVDLSTGAVVEHQREIGKLAGQLGLTREQYLRLPAKVRTKVEADGLPQTIDDTLRLIGEFKGLQSFRNIKTLIEATNAPLSIAQIETLKKRYDLTPKQVKTLVEAVGVVGEAGKVRSYTGDLKRIPPKVTTEVHTQYTYSGLKSPTRSSGGGGGGDVSPRVMLDPTKARDDGYDYATETMVGFGLGMRAAAATADKSGETVGEATGDGVASGVEKKADKAKKALGHIFAVMHASEKDGQTRLEQLGETLTDSFAEGLVGNSTHVTQAMQVLFSQLDAVHNATANRIASTARAKLSKLGGLYADVSARLLGAQNALQAFEAARQVVEKRQAALNASGGDLTGLNLGKDAEGNDLAPTADGIVAALAKVSNAAGEFDTNLQRLADAGLSQDALDELIAKGPEAAAATAAAILAGGPEAIAKINALQTEIATTGLSIQSKASQTMYDAGVAAQQGLISGLESQMTTLEEKMGEIAKAMVKAIRRALKIKSPSRVMQGLGEFTGAGFAIGLDSTVSAVQAASDRMAEAATIAPVIPIGTTASAAARLAAPTTTVAPTIRVFIGDRELTDIVRVEISDAVAPISTAIRQGA